MSSISAEGALLGLTGDQLQALHELVRASERTWSRSGTATKVAADTNVVSLLETNRFRHMATIYNDSTAVMYLTLGPNAAVDMWSAKLNSGDYYETPAGYTGPITAVWAAVNGQARVTELV